MSSISLTNCVATSRLALVGPDCFYRAVGLQAQAAFFCSGVDYNPVVQTRKRFHLPRDSYLGCQIYFVTICSAYRRPVFNNFQLAATIIAILKAHAALSHFLLHAWCLMPDHFHALVEGATESSDLFAFVRRFKQRTTTECASARADKSDRPLQNQTLTPVGPHLLWQRNFYEHILRNPEHLASVASYIWMNPVRKGLCASPEEYPFSGTMTLGLKWNVKPLSIWLPPWKK